MLSSWIEELRQVTSLCDNHLSLYQLTVERGTPLARSVQNGIVVMPDPDLLASMYIAAVEFLKSKDLLRYEISNFAVSGVECVHNTAYWEGRDYIGVGPGAHSRVSLPSDRKRTLAVVQTHEPKAWMRQVKRHGSGTAKTEILTANQRLKEVVMTMMRTRCGVTNSVLRQILPCGTTVQSLFGQAESVIVLLEAGLVEMDDRGLRATDEGLNVVDSISCDIIDHLELVQTHTSTSHPQARHFR